MRERVKPKRAAIYGLLVLMAGMALGGCRWASGPGDTVPGPPRALVEKSFAPPNIATKRTPPAPTPKNGS